MLSVVPDCTMRLHRLLALVFKQILSPAVMSTHYGTLACVIAGPSTAILVQALLQVSLREDRLVVGAHGYSS